METEVITYWKQVEGRNYFAPAINDLSTKATDIMNETAETIQHGDNLVVARCIVTPQQLKSLKASPDCFVMRVEKAPRDRVKFHKFLKNRGLKRKELEDEKYDSDSNIMTMIMNHKERSRKEREKTNQ